MIGLGGGTVLGESGTAGRARRERRERRALFEPFLRRLLQFAGAAGAAGALKTEVPAMEAGQAAAFDPMGRNATRQCAADHRSRRQSHILMDADPRSSDKARHEQNGRGKIIHRETSAQVHLLSASASAIAQGREPHAGKREHRRRASRGKRGRRERAGGSSAAGAGIVDHRAPSTKHQAPSTQHPAPRTGHPAPGTRHPAPRRQLSSSTLAPGAEPRTTRHDSTTAARISPAAIDRA